MQNELLQGTDNLVGEELGNLVISAFQLRAGNAAPLLLLLGSPADLFLFSIVFRQC